MSISLQSINKTFICEYVVLYFQFIHNIIHSRFEFQNGYSNYIWTGLINSVFSCKNESKSSNPSRLDAFWATLMRSFVSCRASCRMFLLSIDKFLIQFSNVIDFSLYNPRFLRIFIISMVSANSTSFGTVGKLKFARFFCKSLASNLNPLWATWKWENNSI